MRVGSNPPGLPGRRLIGINAISHCHRGYEPLSWNSAIKFLMARKFHVERSLALYQQHELMRVREGLTTFDPHAAPLREELETGKFTILPRRDANGATLALFNAHKHNPEVR